MHSSRYLMFTVCDVLRLFSPLAFWITFPPDIFFIPRTFVHRHVYARHRSLTALHVLLHFPQNAADHFRVGALCVVHLSLILVSLRFACGSDRTTRLTNPPPDSFDPISTFTAFLLTTYISIAISYHVVSRFSRAICCFTSIL